MQRALGGFRPLHNLASLARSLYVLAFAFDVMSLVAFEGRRGVLTITGETMAMHPRDAGLVEWMLAVAPACALVAALRRAALNARRFVAGSSPLWNLRLRLLRPWNAAGREALEDVWRSSAPAEEAEPPATVRLLWAFWSCWLPCAVVFAVYERMLQPRLSFDVWIAQGIIVLHIGLSVCVVSLLGALARHQDRRTWLTATLPWGSMPAAHDPLRFPVTISPSPDPATSEAPVAPEPPAAAAGRAVDAALPDGSPCPGCHRPLHAVRCADCGAASEAGAYRIEKVLGTAADRRTYLARDRQGTLVTLKEVALATVPDAYALDAFEREAQLLQKLRHPRIPAFVGAFSVGEGVALRFYLAHRFVEGVALEREIEHHYYAEAEVLDALEQVLGVLAYLQSLSPPIFHRDVKPSNLIRRSDGSLVLVDFGAARARRDTLRSATMIGSVGYMPPEQLAGQVDHTSDPYAAGATALHMLTHRQPWEFMDGPMLRPPDLPVSRSTQRLIGRLVAPGKQKRFPTAVDALHAVQRLRQDRSNAGARL
jgi:hypothetical protein